MENFGTMEKKTLALEKYDNIPKTMELWFTIKKKYGTMEKTMVL